jgi:TrmH family RNA methyltransferase
LLTAEEADRVRVVLVGSRNPLNIGAAARAMSNFGFERLRVVRPYEAGFREARSAVDAETVLRSAEEFETVAAAVSDCSLVAGTTGGAQRTPREPMQRLENAAQELRAQLRAGSRVAILFGSEKVGLSNRDLNHCQTLLRIPTRSEHPSMNLGQAVAVVLYELVRQSEPAGAPYQANEAPATAGERERLTALWIEALTASGSTRQGSEATLEEKVRRLVRRLQLTAPDLHEWLGLLRQILWKTREAGKPR